MNLKVKSLAPLIGIILLSIIYVSLNKDAKSNNKLFLALVIFIAVIILCIGNIEESFTNYAPINQKLSPYDGMDVSKMTKEEYEKILQHNGMVKMLKEGKELPLINDVTIFSPVGDGIKLTSDVGSDKFPSIDGKKNSPKQMFMLSHNQFRPECCPSTYSNDRGCACMTNSQYDMIKGVHNDEIAFGGCNLPGEFD